MPDQQEFDEAREYINAATTAYERNKRKQEMFGYLYSANTKPQGLNTWLRMAKLANSLADPIDKQQDL